MNEINELFSFSKDYILEDDTVLLRPLKTDDYENLVDFAFNEPELWKYSVVPIIGKSGLRIYIDSALEAREAGKEYPFIVYDKRLKKYAGSTRFYDIQLTNKSLQLGFTWYGKQFQGTELNKHCKYLLLDFAFDNMQMERVESRADNANEKSIAAMKSIGCVVEGVLRSNALKSDGTRRDSIVLSILKDEWFDKVRTELRKKTCKD
jgi:RimJ/RimL family protein N-acetyltransferase